MLPGWGDCFANTLVLPIYDGMGRHPAFQKQMFSEPPECRSGGLKNQIVAEVGVEGFLEPRESAHSGKFKRRRRDWKFLPLGNLLRVLGADDIGAGFHLVCLGVPIQLLQ